MPFQNKRTRCLSTRKLSAILQNMEAQITAEMLAAVSTELGLAIAGGKQLIGNNVLIDSGAPNADPWDDTPVHGAESVDVTKW